MKKAIVLLTVTATAFSILMGCSNPAMPSAVAEKLEYSLNALKNTVNNLDTVDNSYLSNPDISPSLQSVTASTTAPRKGHATGKVLQLTSIVGNFEPIYVGTTDEVMLNGTPQTDEVSINESAIETNNEILEDGEQTNAEQNNGILENGVVTNNDTTVSNSDAIINNSDATVNNSDATVNNNEINNNNDLYNVVNNDVIKNDVVNTNVLNEETVKTTTENRNNELNKISNEQKITKINQTTDANGNILPEPFDSYYNNNTTQNLRNNNNKYIYNPRYITNKVASDDKNLANYMTKVENLYSMSTDAVEANNSLVTCKQNLFSCIDELKTLAVEMKTGNYTPTAQQINAINNYISDIKTTIARLRSTNGQLNNEINKINSYDKEGLTTSVDVLNSNYMRILNHIDVRITYLKNALSTLEQVKALLIEAQSLELEEMNNAVTEQNNNNVIINETQNNESVTDSSVVNNEAIQNETNTQMTETNFTQTESNSEMVEDTNTIQNEPTTENTTTNQNVDLVNPINNEDDQTMRPIDVAEQNEPVEVEKEVAPMDTTITEETNNDVTNEVNNDSNVSSQNAVASEATNNYTAISDYTNIDTYQNANTEESNEIIGRAIERRNIDTFQTPRTRINRNNNVPNNTNIDATNNTNIQNNDVNNGTVNNGGLNGVNNGTVPAPTYGNAPITNANNGVTNLQNQNDINTPNGTFQNGIITQNNLNQGVNNGVNGVRTGYNGSTNSPYTVDSKGRSRNINTYGQNTLIDMINRGTVNNGVNTLSLDPISEVDNNNKPNMVNNSEIHPQAYLNVKPREVKKIIA